MKSNKHDELTKLFSGIKQVDLHPEMRSLPTQYTEVALDDYQNSILENIKRGI
jgi:hypothetical protein